MNKRLSLLLHETSGQQHLQKTTRTELSEEEPEEDGSVSRAVSILQIQPNAQPDRSRATRRFLEFEEFDIGTTNGPQANARRKFNIQVPEAKFQQTSTTIGMAAQTSDNLSKVTSSNNTVCREPPAPSHKGRAKAFVFPAAAVVNVNPPPTTFNKPSLLVKQPCSIPNIATFEKPSDPYPSQPESPVSGSRDVFQPIKDNVQNLTREELLKQLENYRRELLKRDGQVELLQKIIADNIARPQPIDPSRLLQQKDSLNGELMAKLAELTTTLKNRNQQLALYKYENSKMECMIEAMNHDAYLSAKHQQNEMLSLHNFEKDRRQVSTHWEEDLVMRTSINKSNGARQIQGIQRKMEQLKNHRQQHMSVTVASQDDNNRSAVVPIVPGCPNMAKKTKQISTVAAKAQPKQEQPSQNGWYCQTSKNRPKASGYFDFKHQQQLKENVSDAASQHRRKQKPKESLQ